MQMTTHFSHVPDVGGVRIALGDHGNSFILAVQWFLRIYMMKLCDFEQLLQIITLFT